MKFALGAVMAFGSVVAMMLLDGPPWIMVPLGLIVWALTWAAYTLDDILDRLKASR